jgi:hypothetical protein
MASFVLVAVTFATVVGPIVFGLLGLWLVLCGSRAAQWYECSDCGTKLANKHVHLCPSCKATFASGG